MIYPKDPNVYGVCIRNHKTVMYKCPEEEQFDTKTSQCIFVCKKVGRFVVPGNELKYTECVSVGNTEGKCPYGSIFDANKEKCVVKQTNQYLYNGKILEINALSDWKSN
jgi:ribosomal protein S5